MTAPMADRPHVVYRAYSRRAVLLYVGCTSNFAGRMKMQQYEAPWMRYCTKITTEDFPDLASARAGERAAIRDERPVFNLMGTGRGGTWRRAVVTKHDPANLPQPLPCSDADLEPDAAA